ncbi:MAG TPA: hypothetical protein VMY40_04230 [Anaerolineae bacterium]|nr:hypothetical protein [Anaerolineae bacterium]
MTEKQAKQTQPPAVPSISPQMQAYLNTQIEADEQVLWAGTTNVSGRMKRLRPLVILCLFMMFFCSGLFLLMDNPSRLLLVLLSLLTWAGIPAVVAWGQSNHLRRTLYAITNRRVLIMSVGKPSRTESYPPEKLDFIRPVSKKAGRGDIYFTVLRGKGRHRHMRFNHGFLDIAEVEQVADLMRRTFPGEASSEQ